MLRLTLILWAIIATTLAGISILTVLVVPSLAQQDALLILPAAISGALIAVPISYVVTKKIMGSSLNAQ